MTNPADKVQKWAIDKLIPYARNARTHSDEQVAQIAASIKEWGWTTPVLVDEDGGIIAGHGRTLAAQKLKMTEVPVMVAKGWSDAKKRAYVLADNKLALNAGWDNEMLALELAEIGELGFDLDMTGFTADEIAALTPEQIEPGLTDEDAVPEVPEQPVTVLGDVWLLGKHRLMCGDSTSIDAVDKLMNGQKAEAVLTDPPYNQETEGGFKGAIGKSLKKQSADIEHMCNFEVEPFLQVLPAVHERGKMNATVFCNKDLVPDYLSWARECGYSFNILVWKKPSAIPLGGSYIPDVEYCLVFRKSGIFNTKVAGVSYSKVLSHNRETGLHPTMKPVAMLENQVLIVSNKGGIVLDLFGGSGSTLIACEKTNRQACLMEMAPKYCDVIIKRWQDFTGKIATHAETGQPFAEVKNDKQETSH
jgi:DNA modification methylase